MTEEKILNGIQIKNVKNFENVMQELKSFEIWCYHFQDKLSYNEYKRFENRLRMLKDDIEEILK